MNDGPPATDSGLVLEGRCLGRKPISAQAQMDGGCMKTSTPFRANAVPERQDTVSSIPRAQLECLINTWRYTITITLTPRAILNRPLDCQTTATVPSDREVHFSYRTAVPCRWRRLKEA